MCPQGSPNSILTPGCSMALWVQSLSQSAICCSERFMPRSRARPAGTIAWVQAAKRARVGDLPHREDRALEPLREQAPRFAVGDVAACPLEMLGRVSHGRGPPRMLLTLRSGGRGSQRARDWLRYRAAAAGGERESAERWSSVSIETFLRR